MLIFDKTFDANKLGTVTSHGIDIFHASQGNAAIDVRADPFLLLPIRSNLKSIIFDYFPS